MLSTTDALKRAARLTPSATALIDEGEPVSYAALLRRGQEAAARFRSSGIRTAGLIADNSADWIVADLGAQLAGAALVPIPGFFSRAQIRHALHDSGAEALLLDRCAAPIGAALALERLGGFSERLDWFRPDIEPRPARLAPGTAKVSYTSGTTAEPKGACLPQSEMDRVADSLVQATREIRLRRHLCVLPLALLLENVAGVYAPLRNGAEICIPSLAAIGWIGAARLDAVRLLECIGRFRPDSVILVPQVLQSLIELLERGEPAPASLRFVAVGGGHVAPALLERAETLGLPVYQGYGLTEAGSVVALSSPKQRRTGSVGRPLAHSRVRIGASGEVLVSGASYAGYVGEQRAPSEEIATGDIGRLDDDGYLYIDGRRKNVFISSFGRNVSPEWIEAEIVKQRSIAQVAVFGEARPWSVAVVAVAPGATPGDVDADIGAVNATLPDYARIGGWLPASEAFSPSNGLLTSNGRNRRDAIWQAYRAQINACYDDYLALRA